MSGETDFSRRAGAALTLRASVSKLERASEPSPSPLRSKRSRRDQPDNGLDEICDCNGKIICTVNQILIQPQRTHGKNLWNN